MIKNLFVNACYKLTNKNFLKGNSDDYVLLCELSTKSFLKNIEGITEYYRLEGTKDNYDEMFKDIFISIKKIFLENYPCNILYADTDCLCVKPTEIFELFNSFSMFYHVPKNAFCSYPRSVPPIFYRRLKPWFLSNIRYYPYTIGEALFSSVQNLYENWIGVWSYECILYNTMLHNQLLGKKGYKEIIKMYHRPHLNYQYRVNGLTNEINIQDAHILHFAGSRGSLKAIENMKAFLNGF